MGSEAFVTDAMRAACARKQAHPTQAAARRAKRHFAPNGRDLWVYRCPVCERWHLGHDRFRGLPNA